MSERDVQNRYRRRRSWTVFRWCRRGKLHTYVEVCSQDGRSDERLGLAANITRLLLFSSKGIIVTQRGTLTPRLEIDWNLINPPSTLQNGRSTDTMVAGGIGRGNTLIIECPVADDDAAAAGIAPRNSKLIRTDLCAQVRLILDGRRRDHGGSAAAAAAASAIG